MAKPYLWGGQYENNGSVLHNRNLHISGLLNGEKVDIENKKVDIENGKVDIQDRKEDI